jgi:hypothetical protein
MLNPGTFMVNDPVLIHRSITLRGSGAGVTILKKTNGAKPRTSEIVPGTKLFQPVVPGTYTYNQHGIVVVGPSLWPGPDNRTSQNLTVDGEQGAYSVTIANATGFIAGQFVLVDELSGASWQPTPTGFPGAAKVWQGDRVSYNMHLPVQQYQDDSSGSDATGPYDGSPGTPPAAFSYHSRTDRSTNEIKEIASVDGNTVTFTSPLTISYRTSHIAQLTRYTATGAASQQNSIHITYAGVENLTMIGGGQSNLLFMNAAYSWAKNLELTQWIGEGAVYLSGCFRCEVRDSYLHTASWPQPGGGGYILSIDNGSSELLVENNILIDGNKEMVGRSSGSGSVIAYNYMDDSWIYAPREAQGWVEIGANASHQQGSHHILFEGNYSQNFDADYTHGNSIYITVFRNWFSGQRRDLTDTGDVRAIGLYYGSWWYSFVGNLLGRPGKMSGWLYTDPGMGCDANGNKCVGGDRWDLSHSVWGLGYDAQRWSMFADPKVLSTVIRDGNYDFLTNSQRWHKTPGGFAMPNSLYLTSKPAFFKTNRWPWTDPSTGTIYRLPAKARYDAGTPNLP